jgi:CubicO group peptidase (beta-lactamase class C family)
MRLLTLVVVTLISVSAQAQIKTLSGKTITPAAMDQFLKTQMDSFHIPGLSVAFINGGKIVYHRELGFANLEQQTKVDENSLFEACSMSKTVFAYYVLQLVDKGVLTLDTPLYKYISYPDIAYDDRYKLITARMVLSHTSGLPNWHEYEPADTSLHLPKGAQYLKFTPGTGFNYSGEGYQYLVKVVVHLLHTNDIELGNIVYKDVCVPLGMKHSKFGWNDFIKEHKAAGYRQKDDDGINKPGEFKKTFEEFSAAGGLHSNAVEYAHFMIALMNEKGLSKASFQEMFKQQTKVPEWDDADYWGLGISMKKNAYGMRYMHSGNNGDFTCYFIMYKDKKTGYVFFTNNNRAGDLFDKLEPFFTEGK